MYNILEGDFVLPCWDSREFQENPILLYFAAHLHFLVILEVWPQYLGLDPAS